MKKHTMIFLCALAGIGAAALVLLVVRFTNEFTRNIPGDISRAAVLPMESQLYTQEEMDAALTVAKAYFEEHYQDCALREIGYVGDQQAMAYQDWAVRNDADDVIVFRSAFQTGSHPAISLNANSTYERYLWILVRNEGGQWVHADHGY